MIAFLLLLCWTSLSFADLAEDESDGAVFDANVHGQLLAQQQAWAELFRNNDAQGFSERYTEDAVWLRCKDYIAIGREEIRIGYENWFAFAGAGREDNCTHMTAKDLSDDHQLVSGSCLMFHEDSSIESDRFIALNQRTEEGFQILFQMQIEDEYESSQDESSASGSF